MPRSVSCAMGVIVLRGEPKPVQTRSALVKLVDNLLVLASLPGFVQHFHRIDARIVPGGYQGKVEFPLRVRLESVSAESYGASGPPRLLENIEAAPQRQAVREDIEHPAPRASARRHSRAEPGFGKIDRYAITARRHGDNVPE